MLDGDGKGTDTKPLCCVASMVGACRIAAGLLDEIDDTLLELWKTDEVGDVGADWVDVCGYGGRLFCACCRCVLASMSEGRWRDVKLVESKVRLTEA